MRSKIGFEHGGEDKGIDDQVRLHVSTPVVGGFVVSDCRP
jgi:hypothetical protein